MYDQLKDTSVSVGRGTILGRTIRRVLLRKIHSAPRHGGLHPQIFCLANDLIGAEIIIAGGYEEAHLKIIEQAVKEHRERLALAPGTPTAILDIGANIGSHALAFSALADRVLSFEPNPAVFHVCKANMLLNGRSNVDVFEMALSDSDGKAPLMIAGMGTADRAGVANLGRSSLSKRPRVVEKEVEVQIRKGDSFVAGEVRPEERIVFVKIDVEGHEHNVIAGLMETLKKHHPIVGFEAHNTEAALLSVTQLKAAGYRKFGAIRCTWDQSRNNTAAKILSLIRDRFDVDMKETLFDKNEFYEMILAYP